jgi:hypothetical protein
MDLTIPVLDAYLHEKKTYIHTETCAWMNFYNILFIIALTGNYLNIYQQVNR